MSQRRYITIEENGQQHIYEIKHRPENKTTFGVLSLVFGILSIFILGFLFAPTALILGIIGLTKGHSTTLCVLGIIFAAFGMLTSVVLWSLFATMGLALL